MASNFTYEIKIVNGECTIFLSGVISRENCLTLECCIDRLRIVKLKSIVINCESLKFIEARVYKEFAQFQSSLRAFSPELSLYFLDPSLRTTLLDANVIREVECPKEVDSASTFAAVSKRFA